MKKTILILFTILLFSESYGQTVIAGWQQSSYGQFDDAVLEYQTASGNMIDMKTNLVDWYGAWTSDGNNHLEQFYPSCRPDSLWIAIDSAGVKDTTLYTYTQESWVQITSWVVDTGTITMTIDVDETKNVQSGYTMMLSMWDDNQSYYEEYDFFFTQDTVVVITGYSPGTYGFEAELWEGDFLWDTDYRFATVCTPVLDQLVVLYSTNQTNNQTTAIVTLLNSEKIETNKGTFLVYPNPANDFFILEGGVVGKQVALFDLLGKNVWSGQITSPKMQIDVSLLPAGMYIIQQEKTQKKIMKH